MHSHDDHSGAGHAHAPKYFGLAFAIATALNFALVAVQVFYGITANSVALLADAGHNFGDALGLLMAWGAHALSVSAPTRRYTYGYLGASILSALANGVILLVATGAIAWEAIQRLLAPEPVSGSVVMIAASIGRVDNRTSNRAKLSNRENILRRDVLFSDPNGRGLLVACPQSGPPHIKPWVE